MATVPTAEETAIKILEIFVEHFKCRADEHLLPQNFIGVWEKMGLNLDDFNAGIQYAADQKWIEIIGGGRSYRLTDTGFSKA